MVWVLGSGSRVLGPGSCEWNLSRIVKDSFINCRTNIVACPQAQLETVAWLLFSFCRTPLYAKLGVCLVVRQQVGQSGLKWSKVAEMTAPISLAASPYIKMALDST